MYHMLEFAGRDRLVKDAGDTNGGGWGYNRMGKYVYVIYAAYM